MIAVIGSRKFPDPYKWVDYYLSQIPRPFHIITGDASGIDLAARDWSKENLGYDATVVRAEWNGPRRKLAGKDRNWDIVRDAERVIAFWDGLSNGTAHSIAAAVRFGKRVDIHMLGDS